MAAVLAVSGELRLVFKGEFQQHLQIQMWGFC
jgi:hypothetical protein